MERAEEQPGSEGRGAGDKAAENRRATSFVVVVVAILVPEEETEERAAVAMAAMRALSMLLVFVCGERGRAEREGGEEGKGVRESERRMP